MADTIQDDKKFGKTFWYVCGVTLFILVLIAALVFLPIPEKNQRIADSALAFLMGFMSACGAYLIGANPSLPKTPITASGTTTTEINATVTTDNTKPIINDKKEPTMSNQQLAISSVTSTVQNIDGTTYNCAANAMPGSSGWVIDYDEDQQPWLCIFGKSTQSTATIDQVTETSFGFVSSHPVHHPH